MLEEMASDVPRGGAGGSRGEAEEAGGSRGSGGGGGGGGAGDQGSEGAYRADAMRAVSVARRSARAAGAGQARAPAGGRHSWMLGAVLGRLSAFYSNSCVLARGRISLCVLHWSRAGARRGLRRPVTLPCAGTK
jgi:hypothetical protein